MVDVYLLNGPDEGLKKDFIRQTLSQHYPEGDLDQRRFFAGSDEAATMIDFLRTPSLFAQVPIAEWYDLALTKGRDSQQLINYCQAPSGEGILFLCNSAVKVERSISACIDKKRQKIFWEMFENRKVSWLKELLRSHGYRIDLRACEHLLDLVDNSTDSLRANAELIMLYADHREQINEQLVEQALIHSKRESVFTLFDSLLSGNLEQTLDIFQTLESRGESAVSLWLGLQRQFAKLTDIKSMAGEYQTLEQVFEQVKITSKAAQKSFRRGCARYELTQLEELLDLLLDYDFKSRQSHTPINRLMLQYFLYRCQPAG